MQQNKSIYVIGFPKSGNTWLTKLLADSLQIKAGTGMGDRDEAEIATSVNSYITSKDDRYVVRKTHFMPDALVDFEPGEIRHCVYIYRDLRDIVISAFFFRNHRIHESEVLKDPGGRKFKYKLLTLKNIIFRCNPRKKLVEHTRDISKGWGGFVGSWSDHIKAWQEFVKENQQINMAFVSYEKLLENTTETVRSVIKELGLEMPPDEQISRAIHRQSFSQQKTIFENWVPSEHLIQGKRVNLRFLRKGVAGDWKRFFTDEMSEIIESSNGKVMKKLGYL